MCRCSPDATTSCDRAGLRSLPREITDSTVSLRLSGNFLRLLTADAFGNLTFLSSLWLDHNNLTFLYPGAFRSLCNLRVLQLSRNPWLTYLHANTFQGLGSLISLDLSHCNLFELHPLAFRSLASLTRLSLEKNHIEALGRDSLKELRALAELNLRRNRLWTVQQGAFLPLERLGVLNLGHNRLADLPDGLFSGLSRLKTLHLEANRLTRINCSLSGLPSLRKLYLNNNRIGAITGSAFAHLPELSFLHLNRNNLSRLSGHLFTALPKLRFVFLSHNPWRCDCGMLWFGPWILTYRGVIEGLHCAIPAVRNQSLLTLLAQDASGCSPPPGLVPEETCNGLPPSDASCPTVALAKWLCPLLICWGCLRAVPSLLG
ncbi:hypothetical protein lerEdw1_008714 [Lerista edwardsae]|nr:hypothetical protein lerEdw1_008714 [Lerista edwardsae]